MQNDAFARRDKLSRMGKKTIGRDIFPARIGVGKMAANIAITDCTQQSIGYGVQSDIGVGMALETTIMRDPYAGKPNMIAGAEGIDRDQALTLMMLPLHTKETYALMETANTLSREQFNNKGENHFHIGVNVAPCPLNCKFCSLTREAGIFTESIEFGEEQLIAWARSAEKHNADAINLMTTGTFPFQRLLEIGRLLQKTVDVPLVANTRDINHQEGEALLAAGYVGAYHAVRLGEGRDTPLNREKRNQTIRVLKEVGLRWMNCIEPVGREHDPEEIVHSVKQGLYVKRLGGGQADIAKGDFVFSVTEGYLIEDGKLTAPVRGATLTGNGPKVLSEIDMVGTDFALDPGMGMCGKGQSARVSLGQPTVRIPRLTVGGTDEEVSGAMAM